MGTFDDLCLYTIIIAVFYAYFGKDAFEDYIFYMAGLAVIYFTAEFIILTLKGFFNV